MFRYKYFVQDRFLVLILASIALVVFAGSRLRAEVSEGVRLLVAGETLEPSSVLEVRFQEPAADDQQVGKIADPSPLAIKPDLPGSFQWLSRRSGVFIPSEPPRLGCEYHVSLRPDLRRPDGGQLVAQLQRQVRTPGFRLEEYAPHIQDTNDVSSELQFQLGFNANVLAESARGFIEFEDAYGQRVKARVVQASRPGAGTGDGPVLNGLTWEDRFYQSHPNLKKQLPREGEGGSSQETIPHQLVVTPVRPLPVGTNWQLVLRPGLPAAQTNLFLHEPWRMTVGNVLPFTVTEIYPGNQLNSGKCLRVGFSKKLGPGINETNVLDWINIDPEVSPLEVELKDNRVVFKGDFKLNQTYTVTVSAGLPGISGFQLAEAEGAQVVFPPVEPRLYFPAFSTEQLSAGRRRMELLTVNVPNVRLRAKLLDRFTLVHALRGYRDYIKHNYDPSEPYREVDFNLMAGKTIFQTNLVLSARMDQAVTTELSWDRVLGGRPHGAVFLAAEQNPGTEWGGQGTDLPRARLGTQTLVQITDLGLYWKRAGGRLWAAVFSYTTGRPLTGVTLRLLNNDAEVLQEAQTGSEEPARMDFSPDAVWLMAEKDGDLHVARIGSLWENLLPVNARISREWDDSDSSGMKLMLFSDRPVYRPGEVLNLKGILREWNGERLVIPNQPKAELKCFDSQDRLFCATNLAFTDLGTVSVSLPLTGSGLGFYRAELLVGTNIVQTHYFQVQQFKPNVFELVVKAPSMVSAQDPVIIPIQAQYYMGRPLSRARVQWSIQAEDAGFSPEGYEGFVFCTQVESRLGRDAASIMITGETNGPLPWTLQPEIPMNPAAPQPRRLDLQVELTDFSQQTLTARSQLVRHSSEFYLGLKRFPNVAPVGRPLPIQLVAVRPDGLPWGEPVKAQLKWKKVEWRTVRLQGAGNARSYRSEPEIIDISEQEITARDLRKSGDQWELASEKSPSATLTPESAGLYLLEATTRDRFGHEVITAVTFLAASQERLAWNYRNEVQIELTPDLASYQAGQTARILVKTPISGTATVTLERDRVFRQFTTNLVGNAPLLLIPLRPEDAPNVFVSVFITRGMEDCPRQVKEPEFRIGYCQLEVQQPSKQLKVDLGTEQPDYRPGQMVKVRARVKDGTGQPAAHAEVTLFAVDEGVLSLAGYEVPDPAAYFWAPHRLAVWTHSTLPALMPEDTEEWRFQNKGYLVGGGGKEGGSHLRKNFQACAFWNATLRTDADGNLAAEFTVPDSMTRYRLIAVALTVDQFGVGQSAFAVNKPLMVEPALPRFANAGDQLLARAVVHSQGKERRQVEVALSLDANSRGSEADAETLTRRMEIGAGQSAVIDFPVKLVTPGLARWIWRARYLEGEECSDSVQSTLPVGYPVPLLREVHARRTQTETNLLSEVNPQLREGQGTIHVTVANTRLAELGEATERLLHYPYGCAEQTASSLIPWIVMNRYRDLIPALRQDPASINRAVEHGVERLLSMQTLSGGLAYWPNGSEPMLWASAYGGLALVIAQKNGFAVPQDQLDRLLAYLGGELRKTTEWYDNSDIATGSLSLYTLAMAGQPLAGLYEDLFARRERLCLENRAMLALAMLEGQESSDMAAELLQPDKKLPRQEDWWFGNPSRELAVQLLAWTRLQPENARVEQLAEELLQSRKDGHWTTTQGNAWALLALQEYLQLAATTAGSGSLVLGTDRREFSFTSAPGIFEATFTNSTSLRDQPLWLRPAGLQTLYSVATIEAYPRFNQQPGLDHGFSLRREYVLMNEEGVAREFKEARVGDSVLVTLRFEARDPVHYLAIEDPWPSLFEGVNPEFKSQQTRAGERLGWSWSSDFHEFRNDRALFFKNYLAPGQYAIQYLLRIRAAGAATAPAAKMEEMYHPNRFGLSESVLIHCLPSAE